MEYSHDFLVRWADVRSTSIPVATAILITARDEQHAQLIWEGDADDVSIPAIIESAWALADKETTRLWWGDSCEERPALH